VPRLTQPAIPMGSSNEDQLWLGRQRQVWLIPFVDKDRWVTGETVQCNPLKTRAIPKCLSDGVGP